MKKQILAAMTFIIFSTIHVQADQKKRVDQVAAVFLKQANTKNTEIAEKLQSAREEQSNGFCDIACVIPLLLKSSDIHMVVTSNSLYPGKFEGDENEGSVTGGYENWTFDVHVPARSYSYGGRISSMETIVFECSLHAIYEDSKAQVECSAKNVKNGTILDR